MKPWSANGLVETGVGATGVRVDLLLVGTPWIRVWRKSGETLGYRRIPFRRRRQSRKLRQPPRQTCRPHQQYPRLLAMRMFRSCRRLRWRRSWRYRSRAGGRTEWRQRRRKPPWWSASFSPSSGTQGPLRWTPSWWLTNFLILWLSFALQSNSANNMVS